MAWPLLPGTWYGDPWTHPAISRSTGKKEAYLWQHSFRDQVGVPNHQISFIWTGRAIGNCLAAVLASYIIRWIRWYVLLLACFSCSVTTRRYHGRSLVFLVPVSLCLEHFSSLSPSFTTSTSFCPFSLQPGSPLVASTLPITPLSSTWWGQRSN